jgi:hypothetical protein
MMSVTMTAQENASENKPEMKRPDMTEMAKQRTDETVKKYGLNEEQAAKLLELNTKYADRMGPRRGGRPDGMRRGERGMRPDSMRQHRQRPEAEMKEAPAERNGRPEMRRGREDFRKQMEEYDAEIQKIMTEEQYKAYKADREKRMQEGPRGFRRDR